jgi:hypothetical protein
MHDLFGVVRLLIERRDDRIGDDVVDKAGTGRAGKAEIARLDRSGESQDAERNIGSGPSGDGDMTRERSMSCAASSSLLRVTSAKRSNAPTSRARMSPRRRARTTHRSPRSARGQRTYRRSDAPSRRRKSAER